MTAKQFMHKIRNLRRRIRLLSEQIERDRTLAEGVTAIRYDKDKIQTSPDGDRMTDIIAKIIETEYTYVEEVHTLQLYEEQLIGYLLQLKEEHERILTYRYLDGYTMAYISDVMGYERQYLYELKEKALNELDEILKTTDTI